MVPFFKFTSAAPKKLFFLKKIHRLNLRKEENLSFDIILFVDDSSLINKISLFDLTVCSLSGRGEVGMFILNIHFMEKSQNWLFFLMISCVRERLCERWILTRRRVINRLAPPLCFSSNAKIIQYGDQSSHHEWNGLHRRHTLSVFFCVNKLEYIASCWLSFP